jgi:hypothetical protein
VNFAAATIVARVQGRSAHVVKRHHLFYTFRRRPPYQVFNHRSRFRRVPVSATRTFEHDDAGLVEDDRERKEMSLIVTPLPVKE